MRDPSRREEPSAEPPARLGPFRLDALLGRGGMGELYRAYDARLDRWVALKLIRADAAGDPGTQWRHQREQSEQRRDLERDRDQIMQPMGTGRQVPQDREPKDGGGQTEGRA